MSKLLPFQLQNRISFCAEVMDYSNKNQKSLVCKQFVITLARLLSVTHAKANKTSHHQFKFELK